MMKKMLFAVFAFALCAGCRIVDRRIILDPGKNEVLRVEGGERLYFDLEENMTTGYAWNIVSDNDDVLVSVEHLRAEPPSSGEPMLCGAPGKASFTIRINPGFNAPATVRVFYKRAWEKEPIKSFTLSLYESSRDWAAWK